MTVKTFSTLLIAAACWRALPADAQPLMGTGESQAARRVEFLSESFAVPEFGCEVSAFRKGDFTGDACDDLLVWACGPVKMLVSNCRDGFVFGDAKGLPQGLDPQQMAFGDFNGDRQTDWVTVSADGSGTAALHLDAGGFGEMKPLSLSVKNIDILRTGKVEGAAKDCLLAGFAGSENWILASSGEEGQLRERGTISLPTGHELLAAIAEVNGDQVPEYLLRGGSSDTHRWWRALSSDRLSLREIAVFPEVARWTKSLTGDFNGDGKVDILAYGGKLFGWWIAASTPRGMEESPVRIPQKVWDAEFVVADINGDKLDELIVYDRARRQFSVFRPQPLPDPGVVSVALPSTYPRGHKPEVCLGYTENQREKWSRTRESCPKNHAIFEIATLGGWRWRDEQIPVSARCCPLPAEDILTDEKSYEPVACPPDAIATGSRQDFDCPSCTKYLECTKINRQRYVLGPPLPAVSWGPRYTRRMSYPRQSRVHLPESMRFGFGRTGIARWDISGCMGAPVGSLFSRKASGNCSRSAFRELLFSGAEKGDPSSGSPVAMLPKCRRVKAIFQPGSGCE